jgi:antitoxin VapB
MRISEEFVMASLFIKDAQTAALAAEVARRTGKTKTAVVREALQEFRQKLPPEPAKRDFVEQWAEYRRLNPLPPLSGLKADKAFYDSLYEDDEA